MLNYVYITKQSALEAGLTHEGTMFGVPAWFDGVDDDIALATPKVPLLHLWCMFADWCYEVFSWTLPEGGIIESPIYVTGAIQQ